MEAKDVEGESDPGSTSASSLSALMRAARPEAERLREDARLPPSELCQGRIRVGRELGRGGMGTVYLASDRDKRIALKTLNNFSGADLYRLKNEFRRLAELFHPNLVTVFELVNEGDLWFFTMEYVDGVPLDTAIARAPVSKRDLYVRALLRQLIEGVGAIHESGLLHRDLKPSNVMVEAQGRLVVLDFGLVSEQQPGSEGQTVIGRLCGTPAYMAPEHLAGEPPTEADDWYAVGVVLYEMLTGCCPFRGSISEILRAKRASAIDFARLDDAAFDGELVELCRELLHPSPESRPTTRAMLDQVRTWTRAMPRFESFKSQPPGPSDSRSGELIGRREEFDKLVEAYHQAMSGNPTVAWVSGPSGIGKTRLLQGFADHLSTLDAHPVILRGRCFERETVPHNAFDRVIDQFSHLALQLSEADVAQLVPRYAPYVARLFPVLKRVEAVRIASETLPSDVDSVDASVVKRRGLSGLKDLMHRLAERRRLVVLLDDMQWADADSLNLLKELIHPPDPPPMLIIASSHTGPAQLLSPEFVRHVRLAPMSAEESRELATHQLPAGTPHRQASIAALVEQAEGQPLYLIELARSYVLNGEAEAAPSLRALFQRHISELPPESAELLQLVAIAGRPLHADIAEDMLRQPAAAAVRVLRRQLLLKGSSRGQADTLEVAHDEVRSAMVDLMGDEMRRTAHSRLADWLLAQAPLEPEWLVQHLLEAQRGSEAQVHLVAASRSALRRGAFGRAVSFLELALGCDSGWTDVERHQLRVEYAGALSYDGRGHVAGQQFALAASSAANPTLATTLRAEAATQWLRAGYLDEGIRELKSVLSEHGIDWPRTTLTALIGFAMQRARLRFSDVVDQDRLSVPPRSELLPQLAALRPAATVLGAFDYVRGAYFSALTLPIAAQAGEPRRLLEALAAEGVYVVMLGGSPAVPRALKVLERIEGLQVEEAEQSYQLCSGALLRAMIAYWSGDWAAVSEPAQAAEVLLEERVPGSSWEVALLRSIRHTVTLRTNPAQLLSELPVLAREATRRGDRYAMSDLARTTVMLDLSRGRPAQALEALQSLRASLETTPLVALHHLVMSTGVQFHLDHVRPDEASHLLETEWKVCCKRGLNRFPLVRAAVLGMRADIIECDTTETASSRRAKLRKLARQAEAEKVKLGRALSTSVWASVRRLEGDVECAKRLSEEAAAAYLEGGQALTACAEQVLAGRDPAALELLGAVDAEAYIRRRRCLF